MKRYYKNKKFFKIRKKPTLNALYVNTGASVMEGSKSSLIQNSKQTNNRGYVNIIGKGKNTNDNIVSDGPRLNARQKKYLTMRTLNGRRKNNT